MQVRFSLAEKEAGFYLGGGPLCLLASFPLHSDERKLSSVAINVFLLGYNNYCLFPVFFFYGIRIAQAIIIDEIPY